MNRKKGWTARGEYFGKEAVYRTEKWPEGTYLFIFTDNKEKLERDELQDTLEIAKKRAVENWGASENSWVEEEWENSYR